MVNVMLPIRLHHPPPKKNKFQFVSRKKFVSLLFTTWCLPCTIISLQLWLCVHAMAFEDPVFILCTTKFDTKKKFNILPKGCS